MPRALITGITGITGQDGPHLGELLAAKGYGVFGLAQGQGNPNIVIVEQINPNIECGWGAPVLEPRADRRTVAA